MSAETIDWLNTNTLIGATDQRGNAWHYRAVRDGEESNHYPGAIPVGDVERRLFHWEAVKVPVFAEFPATIDTADKINDDGTFARQLQIPGMVAIARSDNQHVFKVFTDGYEIHQYREWLLGTVSNLLGDTLVITSAGLLRQGGQAWVEVSVPETIHDEKTGFAFRPNLLAATSLDGTLATTFARTINATVCDNTMAANLAEAVNQRVKVRHSKYSGFRQDEVREALSIVTQTADDFTLALHTLTEQTVTDRQWFKFLDVWAPLPQDKKEGRAHTIAERKRDELTSTYRNDKRVSDWTGTAWGVVQAVNTWQHHIAQVRGAERTDRNQEAAILGKFEKLDGDVVRTLTGVLS